MRIGAIGLFIIAAATVAACSPAPGSAEWCKGVIAGNVKATPEEMLNNMESCAKHELAG